MLDLLARLTELHVTEPTDDTNLWKHTSIFTEDQFALIMTKCLRSAGLPVGGNKTANAAQIAQSSSVRTGADATASAKTLRMKRPSDRLHSFAVVLVYSMANDSDPAICLGGSKALAQLAKFVQATESYFHPSNWGLWQAQLTNFVQHLTWAFARRHRAEAKPDCRTPTTRRLTPLIKQEFVRLLRTVSLLSIFAKDPLTSLSAQSSIKRMAFLQPEMVLPAVLQRSYSSLESLETTQRTTAVIATLSATSQALLSPGVYAPGAKHLAPLLHLCLPGIDMNDPIKTVNTCMLVLSMCTSIIISDASMPADDSVDEQVVRVDDENTSTRAAEDYEARLSTAELDAWSTEFVRRVLVLFAALPEEGKSGKIGEKNEEMVLNMLIATCDAFCSALGEDAYVRCLDIVLDYARTTVAANGVKAIGSLVGCFARANPALVLDRLVPFCCQRIESELYHGASSVRTTSTSIPLPQDTALHWHIGLLSNAVIFAGAALLPHEQALLSTMALLVEKCHTERGYMLTGKLIQRVLGSLINIYPAEQRCVPPEVWASAACREHPHRFFGQLYTASEVEVTWHTPTSAEIDMALTVLEQVVEPAQVALRQCWDQVQASRVWHNDVCRYLLILRYGVLGQFGMLEDARRLLGAAGGHHDMGDVEASRAVPPLRLYGGWALDAHDPRASQVQAFRDRVGDTLARAADVVPRLSVDHVDAMKQLVRALRTYLAPTSALQEEMQGLVKAVSFFRTIGRRWAKQQRFPRIMWIRRAALYHVTRQRLQMLHLARTPQDDALLSQLRSLCMSHYVAVRRLAQSSLDQLGTHFAGTRFQGLPQLLASLSPSATDEQVKGALHVLNSKAYIRAVARNPRFMRAVLVGLIDMQNRSRPSIQKLVRTVLHDMTSKLEDPSSMMVYGPSASLTAAVSDVQRTVMEGASSMPQWQDYIMEENEALLQELLRVLQSPDTHWAYKLVALGIARARMPRNRPVSAALMSVITQLAVSSNPEVRNHAQTALTRALYIVKLRSLASGDDVHWERAHQPLKHEVPLGDVAARTAAFCQPVTRDTQLHDKGVEGWLAWSSRDTYYEVSVAPCSMEPASQPAVDAVSTLVLSDDWWHALERHLTQEMDRDYLASDTTTLLKSLFQMVGAPLAERALSSVASMVAQRDRHQHRAAAELIGGMLRGMKHWPWETQTRVYHQLEPWLLRTMTECTLDSQAAWQMCVEYVLGQRDPRRTLFLVERLWTQAMQSLDEAGLGPGQQAHAQQLLASAVHAMQAKVLAWDVEALADMYVAHIAHDYQEVRYAIGDGLVELELAQTRPHMPSVAALLQHCAAAPSGSLLLPGARMRERVASLQAQLQKWRELRLPSAMGTSEYDRAATTVVHWVSQSLEDYRVGPMASYALAWVPELFAASQLRDHAELTSMASEALMQLASYPFSAAQANDLLRSLLQGVRVPSWHSRLDTLPLLQIVYFQNLFFLSEETQQEVLRVLVDLLRDPHVEVRDMAATTLAGVVQCSQRVHIVPLSREFEKMAATPLPKRGAPAFETALLQVHAGVLGACALVAAFPYEVPDWVPSLLLDTIAPHSDSPVPISTTVRHCAAQFRRTHQDTWEEDQRQFHDRVQEVHDFTLGRSDYFV